MRPRGDVGEHPAGARACVGAQHTTAHHSTPQHSTAHEHTRPTSAVRARARSTTPGQAPGQGLELVHVKNPADRLDRLRAHDTRHDRRHEKQERGRHARGMCTHSRPTAAACRHPPKEPPPPLAGVYPPWGGDCRFGRPNFEQLHIGRFSDIFFCEFRRDDVGSRPPQTVAKKCWHEYLKNYSPHSTISDWIFLRLSPIIQHVSITTTERFSHAKPTVG